MTTFLILMSGLLLWILASVWTKRMEGSTALVCFFIWSIGFVMGIGMFAREIITLG